MRLPLWAVLVFLGALGAYANGADDAYLTWTSRQVDSVGKELRVNGRVGGLFDLRIVNTNRSYNYKLRATWMTPDTIRASARLHQLRERLSDEQTRLLVQEAEAAGDTVIMIEIDPREGSGVIPLDWLAFLRPKGNSGKEVPGVLTPQLRSVKALSGVMPRDYAYDVFWAVFPLTTAAGDPLFSESDREAELIVSIHNKQGQVAWKIPDSIRSRRSGAPGL